MTRKEFISHVGIGAAALLLPACLGGCQKSTTTTTSNSTAQGPTVNFTLDLTQAVNSALNTSGGSVASNGVVIVNTSGSFIAIAQTCTHQGCSVSYNQSGNDFVCPCHSGVYDLNGNVTSGPPPAPLKKYTVTKSGNILTIKG